MLIMSGLCLVLGVSASMAAACTCRSGKMAARQAEDNGSSAGSQAKWRLAGGEEILQQAIAEEEASKA